MDPKKDSAQGALALYVVVVLLAAGVAAGVLSGRAESAANVQRYLGRAAEPDRLFWIPLVLITAALIAAGVLVFKRRMTQVAVERSAVVDATALDAALVDDVATFQLERGGMSHATVVKAAHERGYRLTSQGADGSLVFERSPGE